MWEFVGREAELASAASALDEYAGLVVAAEPGVGGSRFGQELGNRLKAGGRDVEVVVASPALQALPFGALARLLPPLREPARDESGRLSDEVLRAAASLRSRFRSASATVIVDNADHLDELSVEVIHTLIAEAIADLSWVLLVHRPGELPARLRALWEAGQFAMVSLSALSVEDFQRATAAATRLPVPRTLARSLHAGCRGNIRLLHEYVEGARAIDAVLSLGGECAFGSSAMTSPRLMACVDAELASVSDEHRDVLELVAVSGGMPDNILRAAVSAGACAALERSGFLEFDAGAWRLAARYHEAPIAEAVSDRRRHELLRSMIEAQDIDALSSTEFLLLVQWDLDGPGSLGPDVLLRGVGIAADHRHVSLARRLLDVTSTSGAGSTSDGAFAHDVQELAVMAAEGSVLEALHRARELIAANRDFPARLEAASQALSSLVRRFEMDTGDRLSILEDVRLVVDEQASLPGVDNASVRLLQAQVLLSSGRLAAAADLIDSLGAADLRATDRATYLTTRVAVQAGAGRPEVAGDAVEEFAAEVGFDGADPASHLVAASAALAATLGGGAEASATSARLQRVTLAHRELAGSLGAIGALQQLVSGRLAAASERAVSSLDRLSTFDPVRLGSVADAVLRFNQTVGQRRTMSELEEPELWKPVTGLLGAWVSADWAAKQGQASADLFEHSRRSAVSGWQGVALFSLHLAARYAPSSAVIDAVQALDREALVGARLVLEHAQAAVQRDPVRLLDCATRFVEADWLASAVDSLRLAGDCLGEMDDPHQQLIAAIAGDRLTALVDNRMVLTRHRIAPPLSARESQVLAAVAMGQRAKVIAANLELSPRTVDNHLYRLYQRFELSGRNDLLALHEWVDAQYPAPAAGWAEATGPPRAMA